MHLVPRAIGLTRRRGPSPNPPPLAREGVARSATGGGSRIGGGSDSHRETSSAGALLLGLSGAVCSAAADESPAHARRPVECGARAFTHSGPVSAGQRSSSRSARPVDDILKSMTVFDREGAVGAVSLPARPRLPNCSATFRLVLTR